MRRFGKGQEAKWVALATSDLVPVTVGPHAAIILAWDRRTKRVVFYSSRDGQLVFFSYDEYSEVEGPSGEIDDRGVWTTWPIAPDIVRRYDLGNRKWVETNEPLPPSQAVREGDVPGTSKVRLPNGGFKQIPCRFAFVVPWLPEGQVIAEVAGPKGQAKDDLCVWDVTQNKAVRVLWRDASFRQPSPSGRFMLVFIESPTDLIFGWRYTILDLRDDKAVDRFAYNVLKGGDHTEWAACTQEELEKTLQAARGAIDQRQGHEH